MSITSHPNFLSSENHPAVHALLEKARKQLENQHKFSIEVNPALVDEAIKNANHTLDFHLETAAPNVFKQASHLCYWLCKIKPFKHGMTYGGSLAKFVETKVGTEDKRDAAAVKYHSLLIYPINEYIAAQAAIRLILQEARTYLEVKKSKKELNDDLISQRQEFINIQVSRLQGKKNLKIIDSLSYHNYSARALATLFETYFEH